MSGRTDLSAALAELESAGYESAWSMPASYYADPEILALEKEHLFGKEWVCIGRVEEVADPGDSMAFTLCEQPLVAVRGDDSKIRVFSNVCRHRGAILVDGKSKGRRIVCPYHHWSYDLDGRLAGAPRMEAHSGFSKSDCRLPEYAVEEWCGFLFTTLAENPEPLGPRLEPLKARIGNYHMEQMKVRHLADEIWHTNWKCLIENFMEAYHLSPLHRTTLHPVNPTRLCTHFPAGDAYFGYNAGYSPDLPRSQKGHPDLTDAEADNCVMFAIPPGLVSGCGGDYSSFICIQPETIDRVRAKLGLIFYGDGWTDAEIEKATVLFNDTMSEDKSVLVGLMRGLAANAYARGPLAPADFEGNVFDFYRYFGRRMAAVLHP
ncbi:MAG: aromatic ring-hydroxylating dioxygenase subunit alpha [Rhizobium sp.]|nr:aromatic ring-hydroxylating dioxygenase subunit alpha [Rhizobium sp.]